jgi:hypothetical protein
MPPAKLEALVLAWTERPPRDGSRRWSTRRLGKALGISNMTVARIWAKHELKPHRLQRCMAASERVATLLLSWPSTSSSVALS